MSVKPTSPDAVNLFLGTPMDALSGTMSILMKTNKYYTDNSLLKTGTSYTVTQEWGKLAVEKGWASEVSAVVPQRQTPVTFSSAEQAALRALLAGQGLVSVIGLSAVPIAHTGTTVATILAEVPIPAGIMGPNGALRVTAYWSMTNNANSKNLVISWGLGAVQVWSAGLSSVAASACQVMVSNRGATGSQLLNSGGTGVSLGTLPAMSTASEDTTIQQRIRFTGNLSNAGDTLTLERYVVELLA